MKAVSDKEEQIDKLTRIEKKVDMLNNFINNEFRNMSEELSNYKKNFFTLEIIFYIILGISVLQLIFMIFH